MASESSTNPPSMRARLCTFQFEIDYSHSKDLSIGDCISSPTFSAGGYNWSLEYYPQGYEPKNKGSHVSLLIVLQSEARDITAAVSFDLLLKNRKFDKIFMSKEYTFSGHGDYGGYEKFCIRDKIKVSYCVNNLLVISCNIQVMTEPSVADDHSGGLCAHIEKLWKDRERFDVTFEIEGESISAHRFMLAARSPVFKAKLYGSMAEAKMKRIKIDEMKAEVFKALLHFIYTDQLLVDDTSDSETDEEENASVRLLQGLFVAADRYGLDKLTQLCEIELERNLSVDTVATTLILADQHSRTSLKRKCLDFASVPENFVLIALTEGYLCQIAAVPALLAELSERVKGSSHLAKRQRIGK